MNQKGIFDNFLAIFGVRFHNFLIHRCTVLSQSFHFSYLLLGLLLGNSPKNESENWFEKRDNPPKAASKNLHETKTPTDTRILR